MSIYKAELRSIDAWRDGEDGWTWNDSFHLCDVAFIEDAVSDTRLIQWLVDENYLREDAADKVEVYHDGGGLYEIQVKATGEPIYAFVGDWYDEENSDA